MAHGKSLECRKIIATATSLGEYVNVAGKSIRKFKKDDFIYSKDGITKYIVGENGNFLKFKD